MHSLNRKKGMLLGLSFAVVVSVVSYQIIREKTVGIKITVLMYHHFTEDVAATSSVTILKEQFEEQLTMLKEEGYTVTVTEAKVEAEINAGGITGHTLRSSITGAKVIDTIIESEEKAGGIDAHMVDGLMTNISVIRTSVTGQTHAAIYVAVMEGVTSLLEYTAEDVTVNGILQ